MGIGPHSSFDRSVTNKVRNHIVFCFPISHYLVVLHYRAKQEIQKLRLFTSTLYVSLPTNTQNTFKLAPTVTVEPSFIPKVIDCMHRTIKTYLEREQSILLSVTHTLHTYVYQVCHGVGRSVEDRSGSSSSLEWKPMRNINGISYYLNKC